MPGNFLGDNTTILQVVVSIAGFLDSFFLRGTEFQYRHSEWWFLIYQQILIGEIHIRSSLKSRFYPCWDISVISINGNALQYHYHYIIINIGFINNDSYQSANQSFLSNCSTKPAYEDSANNAWDHQMEHIPLTCIHDLVLCNNRTSRRYSDDVQPFITNINKT